MFVDLTASPPLFVASICPFSLVVRTMANPRQPLQGQFQRKQAATTAHKEHLVDLPPSITREVNGYLICETFIPLDSGRAPLCIHCQGKDPRCWQCRGAQPTPQDAGLFVQPPWEVATLAQNGRGRVELWRGAINVVRQKDPKVYMVTVGDVATQRAYASALFKIDTLAPLTADRTPLQDMRKPAATDAYGQILDDE